MKNPIFKTLLICLLLSSSMITNAKPTQSMNQQQANLTLVTKFYNQFFNKHETLKSSAVIANDYIQHNPEVPDGKAPFVGYFSEYFKENPDYQSKIVRSATDGDLVWLHVHSTNGKEDLGQAVVDIFRVKDGRIVEHWDVIQAVPASSENANTMF